MLAHSSKIYEEDKEGEKSMKNAKKTVRLN
jgi:hypothetical protein